MGKIRSGERKKEEGWEGRVEGGFATAALSEEDEHTDTIF